MPRALKEWLKDLAARCSRVCRKTSTLRGLKVSPSSEENRQTVRETKLLASVVFGQSGDEI